MNVAAAFKAFAAVFLAELPDKTMIATVVLVAHHQRPWWVWCGAASAFTLHVALAVAAGGLLGLLPSTAVTVATAALFATGAVLLWRGASNTATAGPAGPDDRDGTTRTGVTCLTAVHPGYPDGDRLRDMAHAHTAPYAPTAAAAFFGSFGVILLAEWGDLTQLATASTAASTGAPLAVAAGALVALWLVAALAATLGGRVAARLPVPQLRRAAALVFATLATLTLFTLP